MVQATTISCSIQEILKRKGGKYSRDRKAIGQPKDSENRWWKIAQDRALRYQYTLTL